MAATKVLFPAPSGQTLVAYLRKYGTSTFISNSGHSATEVTINGIGTGDYLITVSQAATGWHRIYITKSSNTIASYDVYLQDDTDTYKALDADQTLIFSGDGPTSVPLASDLIVNTSAFLEQLEYSNLTTAEQASVDALITAASEWIERYCNRSFLANDYTDEKHDGNGWDALFIKNPPINSLTDIDIITYNAVTGDSETTTYTSAKFTYESKTGEIRFKPDVVLDTAKFFPTGFQNVAVTYNGGFSSVPKPIQMLTADFVIQMFNPTEMAEAVEREKLGDYFYALGNQFYERLPFSKKQILSSYRIRKV